jgi:hypothetical protein
MHINIVAIAWRYNEIEAESTAVRRTTSRRAPADFPPV